MDLETPRQLLERLKIGREEFCQRLLTCLIVDGPYPKWNTRSIPCPGGTTFLRALHELSFGQGWPSGDPLFVDEFELVARHEGEQGGAPDYAVLWPDRVWLIELKTERSSHRANQIPGYFDLAHHHFPTAAVDITYVTSAMTYDYGPPPETWARYAHVTWDAIAPVIVSTWRDAFDANRREVVDGLCETLANLDPAPGHWRARFLTPSVDASANEPEPDPSSEFDTAMRVAGLTAEDGEQRAFDSAVEDLEALLALRLDVREALAEMLLDSPLRHVVPWLWRPESLGQPMTPQGSEHGFELRFSRYEKPQY